MPTSPHTEPSLLVRIRDERDQDSWSSFVEIYAPLVYAQLRKCGLQDADAADLTQEVMASVATAIKSFDYKPELGSFRRWLFTVVQNRVRNFRRSGSRRANGTGDTQAHKRLLAHPDASNGSADQWDRDYESRLFNYAADQVRSGFRDSTWQAFWRTSVNGESTKQVAESLEMTMAAVRLAKARVIARIKEHICLLEGE